MDREFEVRGGGGVGDKLYQRTCLIKLGYRLTVKLFDTDAVISRACIIFIINRDKSI